MTTTKTENQISGEDLQKVVKLFLELALSMKEKENQEKQKVGLLEKNQNEIPLKNPSCAAKIREGFKQYGPRFCINNDAEDRDKIYQYGFRIFLSKKIKISPNTIGYYDNIRKNAPTEFVNALCEKRPYKGVFYSLRDGWIYVKQNFPLKNFSTASKIEEGFKQYGPKFCINNDAEDRDKVYKTGFYKFLSQKIKVGTTSITQYGCIKKNGPPGLLDTICKGKPFNGVYHTLKSGYALTNQSLKTQKEKTEENKEPVWKEQASEMLRKIFGVPFL